ncbi:hypothetical protein F5876DRAFT_71117 [Lentinula aff. lateritia]|uniref:Uncharacterized protein n=1 Tax=Lentinula aff. lateritia TaxID=2804960 RepID=A0ACC1TH17_9AGAR|nr:hypothetical protein F5876DRAFT_71117 [Lentinula aff. lateritia]
MSFTIKAEEDDANSHTLEHMEVQAHSAGSGLLYGSLSEEDAYILRVVSVNGANGVPVYIISTPFLQCAIFVSLFMGNEKIPSSIVKCGVPKVVLTQAKINEACSLYIEGRCQLDRHCLRIHLIPPLHEVDVASDLPESGPGQSFDNNSNSSPLPSCNMSLQPLTPAGRMGLEEWGYETDAGVWLVTEGNTTPVLRLAKPRTKVPIFPNPNSQDPKEATPIATR